MTKKLIKIAEVAQLPPGSRKLCTVDERRVALFNLNGTIHAIDNHCTHRDGPVAAGELKDAVITCPWHGWRFNVTTGRCLESGGAPLRLYPVTIEGNDILIDVTTSSSEADDGIYSWLVRYGVLGHVSRVGSNRLIPCSRGDRVVVHTDRGLEIGEVLETPSRVEDNSSGKAVVGELLRAMTEDDRRQLHEVSGVDRPAFQNCRELLAERSIPVNAVDAELLFDDQTIIIYYLGQHTDELGPLSVELSKVAENRLVQFQPIENIESSSTDVAQSREQQEIKRSKQERVKESSQFLRGTILDELSTETDKFPADDVSLLKFHGTYQQDDRDARKTRNPDGGKAGKQHSFMVRMKIPGGRLTAGQLLGMLDLSDECADGTLRVTTRQGLQLHGVVKGNLWQTIHDINSSMLTTLGACGDVVRNVMCCPVPQRNDRVRSQMQSFASDLAKHFAPRTEAYYDIWVDGEKQITKGLGTSARAAVSDLSLEQRAAVSDAEPIYGRTYLPRKFKIGIALPSDNCIDVFTQDVGLLAVVEAGELIGYNVLAGGGLGNTPSVKNTFPRLADRLAFVPGEEVLRVITAIVEVQRDHGNRENRRRARLKYLVDEWGVERFKATVEEYLGGEKLASARPIEVQDTKDHLGWHPQGDGKFYLGLFVENGRIRDDNHFRLKTGLRRLLERYRPPIRLTPQQSILLCDLPGESQEELDELLGDHGISRLDDISNVRRHAMACPALPTCGLAITESERVLPHVIDRLENELASLGLNADEFTVRMTGCPNACARPYTADIGLVGKAVGKYTILVGGSQRGDRLNSIYKDMVPLESIVDELLPLLTQFKRARQHSESLGDFCARQSLDELKRSTSIS